MRVPSYRRHSSGNARVTIAGKDYLLGKYGSRESREKYGRLIAEYSSQKETGTFGKAELLMQDVFLAFVRHAKTYFRKSPKQRGEVYQYKLAIRPVNELYGTLPAKEFGPAQYKVVRQWWLSDKSRSRQYVNKQMKRLVRIIKWAVGEGMMPGEAHIAIKCVDPLRKGRCEVKESKPVESVPADLVAATIPHMTGVQADMVRFQMLTGCRPGELVRICPGMVDRSGEVWEIHFDDHKTAHRGKARTVYVGPQAQAVLAPYLLRAATHACFSPQESEKQRRLARLEARRTPLSCGNRAGTNRVARKPRKAPGTAYDTQSYGRAIKYACRRAKLEEWSPN